MRLKLSLAKSLASSRPMPLVAPVMSAKMLGVVHGMMYWIVTKLLSYLQGEMVLCINYAIADQGLPICNSAISV